MKPIVGQQAGPGLACRRCRGQRLQVSAFFGKKDRQKSWREIAREEQVGIQQAVLARRKNKSWEKAVEERRAEVKKYKSNPAYKKKVDDERRERKKRENPDPEVSLFNIIIPLPPFGMPEYDGGERFDLASPYCDRGYVDEDADFRKQFARFFGFGKKEREGNDSEEQSGPKGKAKK